MTCVTVLGGGNGNSNVVDLLVFVVMFFGGEFNTNGGLGQDEDEETPDHGLVD